VSTERGSDRLEREAYEWMSLSNGESWTMIATAIWSAPAWISLSRAPKALRIYEGSGSRVINPKEKYVF